MKKRYAITLSSENVEHFRVLASKIGMPRSAMHTIIDDSFGAVLDSMEQSFDTFKAKGKLTMADMFTQIGQQLTQFEEKEVKENEAIATVERTPRVIKKRKEKKPV